MLLKLKFLSRATAYDNTVTAGWKMNAEGTAVEVKDGQPVYIGTDGKEMIVKGETLSQLRGEAKTNREKAEALEANLKKFEGLDPEKAREAFDKLSKIDQKLLIDSGKVDEVKKQITDQFTAQIGEKDKAFGEVSSELNNLKITNVFNASDFVRNNLAVPRDMFEATFRQYFKVENGKVTAYGKDGNQIMSKKNVGEFATPEEALEILVDQHPQKNDILKAELSTGTGSDGNGGNAGSGRIIRRSELEKMPPMRQAELMKKVSAGEMKLVD